MKTEKVYNGREVLDTSYHIEYLQCVLGIETYTKHLTKNENGDYVVKTFPYPDRAKSYWGHFIARKNMKTIVSEVKIN
jgi:hypothetical protein